jgi:hypothetical protein
MATVGNESDSRGLGKHRFPIGRAPRARDQEHERPGQTKMSHLEVELEIRVTEAGA